MSSVRILIVDDHDAVRRGLNSLLLARSDWEICGEAKDGLDAVEKAKSLRPDLVLMDISMPRMDGLEATRILRKDLPECLVVIVSQNDPAVARRQAHAVGAVAHVTKSSLAQTLLPTLDAVLGAHAAGEVSTDDPGDADLSTPVWLAGGGEMTRLIRDHDWSATPLGPIEKWPQSLKTSLSLIINSQHPMWIGWGRDATFFYNDAYIQVLSMAKHPGALGRPAADVWSEVWDICGPLADKVFQQGEASFLDDIRFFMNRGDFIEELFYSFSYSPIRDESGNVAGLFCPTAEVTPRVINARRLRTLAELSANALTQITEEAACASAIATVAKNPDDIPFALLYLIDGGSKSARLQCKCGLLDEIGGLTPASIELSDNTRPNLWPIAAVAKSAQSQVVSIKGIEGLPSGLANQPLSDAIVLPVTSRGESDPLGVLIAGVNPTRRLDAEYRTFYELVASQIATAIQNARAVEEERKRLEALAEIDRAKTLFFSNVSHEFRTPLTLMLGPVEELLARSHTDLSPSAKTQLEMVNRNGSRLLRLVNTLLDFSRIEAGRMRATYQPTDLAAFTVELASVFRSATEKAGLKLELDCPKLSEPVYVDRNMWENIVLNLISNAFKFTFEGKISVALSQSGNQAELRIHDTGAGIPEHELPHLFDRFHRIENTKSRTHEGSGIGLALVQELVKLHGGSVRAESVLGKGSTFIVSLPLGSAHLPTGQIGGNRPLTSTALGANPFVEEALRWLPDLPEQEAEDEIPSDELIPVPCPPVSDSGASTEQRPLILVADDNSDMRRYLVRLLAERYEVQAVPDGQAALESIRTRTPELVLTDVMMPRLDGFGLLRELRSDPATRTIPIIVLSARAGEEARLEGLQKGADDYLIKPFSARELLARVQTHLELARVRKQSEQALSQRTAQFETLFNEAPLSIFLIDGDFRIREMNPPALRAFGDIPNLVGRDFTEVIRILTPPAAADHIVGRLRRTLETGEPYFEPERVEYRADLGVTLIYEWQINRITLPDGGYGVVSYFRDITAQVRTREAVRENEERLRQQTERFELVAQAAQVGIWFCDLPFDKLIWDHRVKEHFWLPPDADVTIETFYERLHPDDRERTRQAIAESIANVTQYDIEYRTVSPHGGEKWIRAIGSTFYDADGQPTTFDGLTLDITDRKQAEQREQQATAKFRAVFEQTPVFAGIMSVDGRVIDANRLFLEACGYRAEEVLGKLFWDTAWWRASKEVQSKIRAATLQAAQGIPSREVLTYHWADGTERLVDFALHPIVDESGRILFLHPTGVDITDLKRAEEQYRALAESLDAEVRARTRELEQRNMEVEKKSEQLRDLSHRLIQTQDDERRRIARELHDSAGQTLTVLGMNLATLVNKARNSDPELMKIAEEGEQLVRDLSKEIRTTSYLLHPPLLDESGVGEALLWYIRGLRDRSGLNITLAIPKDFGRLSRDMELAIFRIVQECLTNVHRHSDSKIARIRIARNERAVIIEVEDEGKGISAPRLAELQSQGGGVGIRGMRERVFQLGGELKIRSQRGGTTVSFTLPFVKALPVKMPEYVERSQAAE